MHAQNRPGGSPLSPSEASDGLRQPWKWNCIRAERFEGRCGAGIWKERRAGVSIVEGAGRKRNEEKQSLHQHGGEEAGEEGVWEMFAHCCELLCMEDALETLLHLTPRESANCQ